MTEINFAITFPAGVCGLEILYDPDKKHFKVDSCRSSFAKKFAAELKDAIILSLNWKCMSELSSMEDIQLLFSTFEKVEKRVTFVTKLSEEQVADIMAYDD